MRQILHSISRVITISLALAALVGATRARADLQPNEIAIIAARGNRESEGLAGYYTRVRGVPAENICLVDVPAGEICPPEQWRSSIRPAIRKWLAEKDAQRKIRCLLTVWGIPLKIDVTPATAQSVRHQQYLAAERTHRLDLLKRVLDGLDSIAASQNADPETKEDPSKDAPRDAARTTALTPTSSPPAKSADGPQTSAADQSAPEIVRIQNRLEAALQGAQIRASKLTHEEERGRANAQIQQLATAAGGLNVLLPALNQRLTADANNAALRAEFDAIRGRLMGYLDSRAMFEQMPSDIERDAMVLALVERAGGLIASVQWLDQQLDMVKRNETGAAFDSELALILWPDDYQLLRWQPNYLRPNFANSQLPTFYRTMMVARIDAPTIQLATGLIDTALEVEKKGLRGKVYIDARGLAKPDDANPQPGSYADYDRSLQVLAKIVNDQTDLPVVLESTPQLFQPGQCKNAALYCGWYSLGKYIDAFDWVPGAVAYHLASAEATTLRDPNSQVWCKKMLEHGVCATIGPVYEPYLAAFPRPDEFFSLLLHGDSTLVECYAATNPFNSWMMTLIGDPLYRPFKYRAATATKADAPASPTTPTPPSATGKP